MNNDFPILEFNNVFKNYGEKQVLNGISFSVRRHEIIALLGVNGAGKTTAIKLMLGLEAPASGAVSLFGNSPGVPEAREHIGATPQNIEFPDGLKVLEILKFVQSHYLKPVLLSEIIEKFGLNSFLECRAGKLSPGQKRRLALALAFVGDPEIIFLDEPTTGLDVESRRILWDVVQEYARKGKTIFLTTHYLEEIEKIATRILFLHHGIIKNDGTVKDIKKIAASSFSQVIFVCEKEFPFSDFENVEKFTRDDLTYVLETTNSDELVRELVVKNVPFSHLQIVKESLESAFLNLTKRKADETSI